MEEKDCYINLLKKSDEIIERLKDDNSHHLRERMKMILFMLDAKKDLDYVLNDNEKLRNEKEKLDEKITKLEDEIDKWEIKYGESIEERMKRTEKHEEVVKNLYEKITNLENENNELKENKICNHKNGYKNGECDLWCKDHKEIFYKKSKINYISD